MAYHALVTAHAKRTRHTHGSTHAKSSEAPTEKPAASACVSAGARACALVNCKSRVGALRGRPPRRRERQKRMAAP